MPVPNAPQQLRMGEMQRKTRTTQGEDYNNNLKMEKQKPTRVEPEQEVYSGIPQTKSEVIQPQASTEQLQLKLPNGFECMLGSCTANVFQLADLVIQIKDHFDNNGTIKQGPSMIG